MAVVSVTSGNPTLTIGAESSLTQQSGVGIYVLKIDVSKMVTGDTLEIRCKDRVRPTDNTLTTTLDTLAGAQNNEIWQSIPIPNDSGGEVIFTIRQTTGVGRIFIWNLLRM